MQCPATQSLGEKMFERIHNPVAGVIFNDSDCMFKTNAVPVKNIPVSQGHSAPNVIHDTLYSDIGKITGSILHKRVSFIHVCVTFKRNTTENATIFIFIQKNKY